ncbi:MAG: GTPase HflX, partial [Cellulophaga baltica]
FEEHIASVNKILGEIGSGDKKTIMVFNKIDQFTHETIDDDDLITERTEEHFTLDEWRKTWMRKVGDRALFISALNKDNLDEFRKRVYDEVRDIHVTRFPYNNFLYPEHLDEY